MKTDSKLCVFCNARLNIRQRYCPFCGKENPVKQAIPEDVKERLRAMAGDNEIAHSEADKLIRARLRELDPDFLYELDEILPPENFWYA